MDDSEAVGARPVIGALAMEETEVDDRVAAVIHLQQVQQKQEQLELLESHPVTNADAEFRRGLEELVQDHLNTCMALASCSSAHEISRSNSSSSSFVSSQDDSSQHLRCATDGEDHLVDVHKETNGSNIGQSSYSGEQLLAESEGGTGRERDERDGSVHGQEQDDNANTQIPSDLQGRRQSMIMRMWDTRSQEMITTLERQAREAELLALAGRHTVSMLDASFLPEAPSPRSESAPERPHRRASSLVQMWRGIEVEQGVPRIRAPVEDALADADRVDAEPDLSAQSHIDSGEADQSAPSEERVPLLMRPRSNEVVSQESELVENAMPNYQIAWDGTEQPFESGTVNSSRVEIGERERESVRQIVQQWARQSGVSEMEAESDGRQTDINPWLGNIERERVRHLVRAWMQSSSQRPDILQEPHVEGEPTGRNTHLENTRVEEFDHVENLGMRHQETSQMVLELLMRTERERQRELERLIELRTVSHFSQRNRLQYLLRGRFLRAGPIDEEHRPPSVASREIGQLQQRRAVSGLREAFRFRLETIVRGQANSRSTEAEPAPQPLQERRYQIEAANVAESPGQEVGREYQAVAAAHRFESDATAYDMELRELLGRRSVTTILASDFRDRLDHLIRSLVHRQIRSPRVGPQQHEGGVPRAPLTPLTIPSPPPPPPQPARNSFWPRPAQQRSRVPEWEADNKALREDVARLCQGMTEMRRMVEASMDMQYELQRSVRQEVSGALQRMYAGRDVPEEAVDGSRWASVKKGVCCICCDRHINSLLYRCGHMCTCQECANEILDDTGLCPMCRAPVVEVLRAFTIA